MIINSIIMEYFFRIYNSKEIFFSKDINRNVTVIKGDNGTGKTSILSAFYYAFYGDVVEPLHIDNMLNKKRATEMKNGEIQFASVKVSFDNNGTRYHISRGQQYKKLDNGEVEKYGTEFHQIVNISENKIIDAKNFFENIIPKDLRGFFFFDGERIDRLAMIDGREEIKKAILDVLGLSTLERINMDLENVKKKYNQDMKTLTKNKAIQEMSDEYDQLIDQRDNLKSIKDNEEINLKKFESIKRDCDIFLKENNSDHVKNLQNERDRLEKELIDNKEKQLKEKDTILKHISKNFKYYLMSKHFSEIGRMLEEKRKKRELPSDIKERFVKDLLESHTCICGRPLIEGQDEYFNMEKLLQTAGKEELDNSYIKLKSFIESSNINNTIDSFYTKMYEYKNTIIQLQDEVEKINNRLKDIGKILKADINDIISEKEKLRESTEQEILNLRVSILTKNNDLIKLGNKIKDLEIKIEIAQRRSSEKNKYATCFKMASELNQLNDEVRDFFVKNTRVDMDKKIKEVFGNISRKDDREPELTEGFQLVILNKISKKQQILSQGERQITSLSFIGALVSYAREKAKGKLLTDFDGGDFPIVMDSPFGNLDHIHKANVASGISSLATQVIIIVSEEQWSGTVANNISNRVGKMYEMSDGIGNGLDDEYTEIQEVSL